VSIFDGALLHSPVIDVVDEFCVEAGAKSLDDELDVELRRILPSELLTPRIDSPPI